MNLTTTFKLRIEQHVLGRRSAYLHSTRCYWTKYSGSLSLSSHESGSLEFQINHVVANDCNGCQRISNYLCGVLEGHRLRLAGHQPRTLRVLGTLCHRGVVPRDYRP